MERQQAMAEATQYPVGLVFDASFEQFAARLTVVSHDRLRFDIADGPYAKSEEVAMAVTSIRPGIFLVSWVEHSGATVVHVEDFASGTLHSHATLPDGTFLRMKGTLRVVGLAEGHLARRTERNKALVREAMVALFQQRDAQAVARLYAPDYIQHNPSIPQGREALAALVAQLPPDVFYEPGLMIAEGPYVAIHGRIRGWAPVPQVVVDIFRIENGLLAEHWDVLQDEVTSSAAPPGIAMFSPDELARQQAG